MKTPYIQSWAASPIGHRLGFPLAPSQRLRDGNAVSGCSVYNSDKRPMAVYENGQLIARYHYNSRDGHKAGDKFQQGDFNGTILK